MSQNLFDRMILERYPTLLNFASSKQVYGLSDESKSYLIEFLFEKYRNPIVIVFDTERKALNYLNSIQSSKIKTAYFPPKSYMPYGVLSQSMEVEKIRQQALSDIINNNVDMIVLTLSGLEQNLPPKLKLLELIMHFKKDAQYNLKEITYDLVSLGYEKVKVVEAKGEFSLRGDILDIFPIDMNNPIRLGFFDDILETLVFFDVATQIRLHDCSNIDELAIFPIFLVKRNKKTIESAQKAISEAILHARNNNAKIDENYFSSLLSEDGTLISNQADYYLPFFYSQTETILDYFEQQPLVIINNLTEFELQVEKQLTQDSLQINHLKRDGQFLDEQKSVLLSEKTIKSAFYQKPILAFSYLPKLSNYVFFDEKIFLSAETLPNYNKNIDDLSHDLKFWLENNYKILIHYKTDKEFSMMKSLIDELNINSSANELAINFVQSENTQNIHFNETKLIILAYDAIFHEHKLVKSVRKKNKIELSLDDLEIGDYIVHENHGIGIYGGIEHVVLSNMENDYIILQYKGQDRLLVSIEQISHLQKYVGGDEGKVPKITNLNSKEWAKTKAKVHGAIEDIAKSLLEVAAERKLKQGYRFEIYDDEEKEFSDAFPYTETEDQILAIEDTLRDMSKDYPMDRLICGDVGFGKTEVAMRAAYRAVLNHKQVAILVPTTVLCEQHFRNFLERFIPFGVEVEQLSRFTAKKDEKLIKDKLKKHEIDIIIGTHKLLADAIDFSDLGLLVIDEEQRFGVKHKEKIKSLKADVDILTLSATPIPRTLHMSMVGIRDVSLIETPPKNRQPIKTYIIEHNENVIKNAILNEIQRGGQVFYVRNRVDSLDSIYKTLIKLMPDITIGIAHGQMRPAEIDKVIMSFLEKRIDVLLCTTIIETGIDIANANTLIVENADSLGLSQLYQLRGRVGRSEQIGYAYLTYDKNRIINEVAEKRLMTLRQYTDLGAGHKIALKDLQIRGSGNILGKEQSGQMLSVGFELYLHMLEEAIMTLQGKVKERSEVELSLKENAFISENYIKEQSLRLTLYKRIYSIRGLEELKSLYYETKDRYGDMPAATARLFSIVKLKIYAQEAKIEKISKDLNGYFIQFYEDKLDIVAMSKLIDALKSTKMLVRIEKREEKQGIYIPVKNKNGELDRLAKIVQWISSIVKTN